MENKEQELMFKLSMYEQQIQQMQQQLQVIEQTIVDLSTLNLGLDELVGSKDKEIFAHIGQGIFAKAKILSEELAVDIGGKNLVKKSIPEIKEMIGNQIKKLEEIRKEIEENLEKINEELTETFAKGQGNHVCDENCRHKGK